MTSLCGPPTPHHTMHVVLKVGDRQLLVTALRDTGASDTIMSAMLYRQLTDLPLQASDRSFTGIGSGSGKYVGIWQPCVMRLTPRLEVPHQVLISPDDWPYFILGNDLFNKDKVETIS